MDSSMLWINLVIGVAYFHTDFATSSHSRSGRSVQYAASVGGNVAIRCLTTVADEPVDWTFKGAGRVKEDVVRDGLVIDRWRSKGVRLESKSMNEYQLVIPEVQLEDAGVYECIEEAGLGARHSSHLNVSSQRVMLSTTSSVRQSNAISDQEQLKTTTISHRTTEVTGPGHTNALPDPATLMGQPIYIILSLIGLLAICILFIGVMMGFILRRRAVIGDDILRSSEDAFKVVYRPRRSGIYEPGSLDSGYSRVANISGNTVEGPIPLGIQQNMPAAISRHIYDEVSDAPNVPSSHASGGYTNLNSLTLEGTQRRSTVVTPRYANAIA